MRFLACFAFAASIAAAASEWTAVSSPNFELISTASPGDARKALEYFEQVGDFFMRVKSQNMTTRLPVTVIVFRNPKEFKPYAPNELAAAYHTGDQSRDVIVMSGFSEAHKNVAVHEYMHLLIRHMELKLPIWLNEGIAEVYSTLRPLGGKLAVGHVPEGRGWVLGAESWMKLPHLFSITHESPEYNEKNRGSVLYSQSWLLTHMLMLDERYRANFGHFLGQISAGATSEQAFWKVYAKGLDQVYKDLGAYYRANSLKAILFDTKLEKLQVGEPHAADPFDVELALSRLTVMLDRRDEGATRLERLAAQNAKRWEPYEALGQLAWRKGDLDGARQQLRKAVDLKPESWSVYWDYARLAAMNESELEAVIQALQRAVELNASHLDAKLMLGQELGRAKRFGEAMALYNGITKIDPERAPRLFLGKAYAAMRLEDFARARSEAEQALKYAKEPSQTQSAQSMLTYLDRRAEYEKRGFKPVQADDATAVVASLPLTRTETTGSGPVLPSVQGVLQEVDCKEGGVRLLMQAGQRQIGFLISDPDKVIIKNAPGTSMTLTCGKQPAGSRVLIEFEDKPNRALSTVGEVRGLEFLK